MLQNARELKGTYIWINDDYPKETSTWWKTADTTDEGSQKWYRAFIRYTKVTVNDVIFRLEEPRTRMHKIEMKRKYRKLNYRQNTNNGRH